MEKMSNLKEDFQTHLLNDLQPIAQQQQSFEQQNHNGQNSFISQGNSFILDNHNMLSQLPENNQNLNISDHTLFPQQNYTSHYDHQTQRYHDKMSKKQSHTKQSDDVNAMVNEQYKNSSKLQDQLLSSDNDKFNPNQEASDWAQNDAEGSSYTITEQDNSSSGAGLTRGRRRLSVENFIMNHKDHMLLGSKVISGLEKNIVSLPFRQPVDIERFNIPDYHQIVKQPMDLKTIKRKISSSSYQTIEQIYSDIQLIISNSMRYNEFNGDFIRLTKNFQKSYYKIRRDCQRNLRRLKIMEDKKKNDSFTVKEHKDISVNPRQEKQIFQPKHTHHITTQFPTNQVQISSNFTFSQLIKLAKRIKKLQSHQQIQLFKKIDILNTMVIDIKVLSTKNIRVLLKEVQKIEKQKQEMIREEEKKENSHLTVCGSEYSSKCAV